MSDSIFGKVKNFIVGYEEEYEEVEEVIEPVEEKSPIAYTTTEDRGIITDSTFKTPARSNLVDLNNTNHMKVIVYKPTKYSDAEQIVKNLKTKKPVVVNLEEVEVELARKIFNFCSGAICALDGEMRKISKEIFILAPSNVTLDAEKAKSESTEDNKKFDWRK